MPNVVEFPQIVERGCGLDVHKESVVATIKGTGIPEETRTFGTFTCDLIALGSWLQEQGITHLAMESTGIYWRPVYNILSKRFSIILVNARHIKYVPGHKTDRKDSNWIAKLLITGLLKGSFIPEQRIRELRELYHYKRKQIGQRVAERNRVQKVFEDANIKLGSVVSDVFGVTGTAILEAIIQGNTNAADLAALAKGSLKKKTVLLQLALQGNITPHHRFMLKTLRHSLSNIEALIEQIDLQIGQALEPYQQQLRLLETIPGVGAETAA